MQLIGQIILPEGRVSLNPEDEVYAYAGNECRGIARVDAQPDGRLFLTIGSNTESGEKLRFKVFISGENKLYNLAGNLVFESDKAVGDMRHPFAFNLTNTTGIDLTPQRGDFRVGDVYPNPFSTTATVEFSLSGPGRVETVVINSLGQSVQMVLNNAMEPGSYQLNIDRSGLSPGFYHVVFTFRNNADKSVIAKRMVIK
jgi:hypothetical protein